MLHLKQKVALSDAEAFINIGLVDEHYAGKLPALARSGLVPGITLNDGATLTISPVIVNELSAIMVRM